QLKAKSQRPAPNVVVEEVQSIDIKRTFEAPGRVISKYQVGVVARIAGYLQKSYFKEGDDVKKGEPLFLIEPDEYRNVANSSAANVKNIKAQLEYAEKQLTRASELVKMDYIAKSRYDEVLANRDSLRAQLSSAQAQSADANRNLSYTTVRSPIDGRIGMITVTVGNYVSPTSGNITTINSNNPIYVTFPMTAEDFESLQASDSVNHKQRKTEILFQNGDRYKLTGVQDFHDNKVDEVTGTVTMRATFENPDGALIHGEFVNVKLYANNPSKMPIVHQTAVLENQAGKYVYKLDEKGIPQLTYIKTEGQNGDNWIVKSGVQIGDKIVTDGLQKVTPGAPINAVSKEEMAEIKKKTLSAQQEKKKAWFSFTKKDNDENGEN
ncbi:efflux RND transporter periplasmic adaptor subunit, partial [bacterium]|nr:efflux RND transporter periplasmic adaptor subunit [bacterium]